MLKVTPNPLPWIPSEIIVRIVEEAEDSWGMTFAQSRRPEAGVYDPSFNVWDGPALLDYLFTVTDIPKRGSQPAPVLLLNLLLPKPDGAQPPL